MGVDAALTGQLRESWGVPVFNDQIVAILIGHARIVPAHAEWMRRSMAMNRHADADGILAALAAGLEVQGFPADAAEPLRGFLYEWTPYAFPRTAAFAGAKRVLDGARGRTTHSEKRHSRGMLDARLGDLPTDDVEQADVAQ